MKAGLVEINWTFAFQIINTIILYLILKKLLFKPVTEFMQSRTDGISASLEEAESMTEKANELKAQYESKIKASEDEGRQIIREASVRADKRAAEIIKTAEDESDSIKKRAQVEIEREKEKAINSLKDEIATIAIMAASKVIEKDLDAEAHESFVKQFIDEVGDAKWQN